LLTCIAPPLLLADRLEGDVLEASHLGLQESEIHEGRTAVVVTCRVLDAGPADREDRHPTPVVAAHLDPLELAAAHESESAEKDVVGLDHRLTSFALARIGGREIG
jgi:hypothetical protein